MKFFCEYCGARIDADEFDKCPNCGASYKKNKTFIRLEEERNKDLEINNKIREHIINSTVRDSKLPKFVIGFIILCFVIIFAFTIYGIIDFNRSSDSLDVEETEVTVGINEYGETSNYRVKVVSYEVVNPTFGKATDDQEYVKFNLVLENTSDDELIREDVNCIVDGIAQTNETTSGHSDLPLIINKKIAVKGSATFLVPKNAESYDIKYGDYVTIHINKN